MKGIVLAEGAGPRLHPATLAVSKQLLPMFDKPMIYYPLSVLMLAGIREVMVISTPHDLPLFQRLLGDGARSGLKIVYAQQDRPRGIAHAFVLAEDFLQGQLSAQMLGDNHFHCHDFEAPLTEAVGNARSQGATVFAYRVANPQRYGVVEFNAGDQALTIKEKLALPRSNRAPGCVSATGAPRRWRRRSTPSGRGRRRATACPLGQAGRQQQAAVWRRLGGLGGASWERLGPAQGCVAWPTGYLDPQGVP